MSDSNADFFGGSLRLRLAPPLAPSVTSLAFDQIRVGESSATETVFFTNLHSAPVTLTELVVRGTGAFSVVSPPALPLALAPAESVGIDVQFLPLAAGPSNSTLLARQAGQGAPPLEVDLSARAIGPTGADLLFTAAPEAFVEVGGEVWVQEYGFNGGALARLTDPVQGTDLDGLFQWVRAGTQFGYSIPLPNGAYEVSILAWDPVKQGPGQRLFDVLAEGAVIIDDLDLFAEVGRFSAYFSDPLEIAVADGVLDLSFDASVAQAIVSAISVRSIPVLSSPTAALAYGIVDQGTEATLDFVVENEGLHTGQVDRVTFGASTLGSSEDFRIDHGGISYVGSSVERSYAIDPPIDVPPGSTSVSVKFTPTEHEDNAFELELESVERGVSLSASVAGTGGAEAGWGFLHPVPDTFPDYVIDFDGDGVETVQLLGAEITSVMTSATIFSTITTMVTAKFPQKAHQPQQKRR